MIFLVATLGFCRLTAIIKMLLAVVGFRINLTLVVHGSIAPSTDNQLPFDWKLGSAVGVDL